MGFSLDSLKDMGKPLIRGILAEAAPDILAGILVEIMRERRVDVEKAVEWVENDSRLLETLDEKRRNGLKKLAWGIGNLDWMTKDWAVDALKDEFPAVASLFLSWDEGGEWLERQLEFIKEEAKK